jgi:tyrosyl-tRNA synthetase
MFRKVMQISDELMYRYYELLTARAPFEIAALRGRIERGELHPMEAKIELGRLIVTDFHSAGEAARAAEEFDRVVRHKEVPSDVPQSEMPDGVRTEAGVRVDKLLAKVGLADSISDAVRKIRAGAVEINGERVRDLVCSADGELLIQVGKKWRRVG